MTTPDSETCRECGEAVIGYSDGQLCPRCLFALAVTEHGIGSENRYDPSGQLGRIFGNYELCERIGQGGMGVVFRARQKDLGRSVAIKMIRSGPLASEAELARFQTEARSAATLKHPNIVTIHEVGEEDGQPYFSMDLIEGESLAQLVQRRSPAPKRAAGYVETIAKAIDYAHSKGILHRDLKPANVLIDADGELRITDFGLAKSLADDAGLTESGTAMGSPGYSPPEIAGGRRDQLGPASDVYSLGAILYDLLTGRPPFLADTPMETFRQSMDEDPVPPRLLNRRVPRDLETICLKCLEKDPAHRFDTAGELAAELGRFIRGEPVETRPLSSATRIWRWSRRNPALASLTSLLVVMFLLVGTAAFLFRKDILNGNMQEATLAAQVIGEQLGELQREVGQIANDPDLSRRLESYAQSQDPIELDAFLQQKRQHSESSGARWLGEAKHFHSLSLFDAAGKLIARSPVEQGSYDGTYLDRDHFKGAMALAPGSEAYISMIYDSRSDVDPTSRDKFGISLPIVSPGGSRYALLASVPTAASDALSGFGRNAVLIGRPDPTNQWRSGFNWLVIAHPAFGSQSEAIGIADLPIPESEIPGGTGFYFDPAASRYPRFSGPWLAGSAWVEDGKLIVIVQNRDQVTNALVTTAAVAFGAGLMFLVLRFLRRRGRADIARTPSD
jgi:serine/threonine-protein kinase